jgi:DNA-binding HxlR family transcriptional regulator
MVDVITVSLLATSAFFVVLSISLLFRYRQVSNQIVASNDLGKDLWTALESRLKKQDERILDMMGRVEVIQSRVVQQLTSSNELQSEAKKQGPVDSENQALLHGLVDQQQVGNDITLRRPEISHITSSGDVDPSAASAFEAQLRLQDSHVLDLIARIDLLQSRLNTNELQSPPSPRPIPITREPRDTAQVREYAEKVSGKVLLEMLLEKPRTSVEIRERFGITREHAARVLKDLFDRGLVVRNDKHKPFVYELTEMGRQSIATV